MKHTLALILFILFSTVAHSKEFTPNYEEKIPTESKELNFSFKDGLVQIHYEPASNRNDVRCELDPTTKPKTPFTFAGDYKKFQCEITLSKKINVKITGKHGQIQASNLSTDTQLILDDGQIQFTSNPSLKYNYDATVENGMKPMLPMQSMTSTSASNSKPIAVKIRLKNGMVSIQ